MTGEKNEEASTWKLITGVASKSVAEYRARYGRQFNARRFEQMLSGRRNAMLSDCHGVRQDTSIGA